MMERVGLCLRLIRPRAIRAILAVVLVCIVGAIVHFAIIENEPLPYLAAIDGWNDTVLHVGAFAALALAALLIWRRSLRLTAVLLAFGIMIELVQFASPLRQAGAVDVLANAIGIMCGHIMFAGLRWLSFGKIDILISEQNEV